MAQADLFTTGDGSHSLHAPQFGVSYHSRYGAITETNHVFINAGLRYKALVQREIAILETGFGTGLNAWMTLLEAARRGLEIQYTSLEIFPLTNEKAASLNYPELLGSENEAAGFMALHEAAWDIATEIAPEFTFEKCAVSIETFRRESAFDIIYFDAFAPQAQPELWTQEVMQNMYDSLRPDGVLVTYCAQGEFKRRLKRAGFTVERLEGPPGKREMTRATRGGE